MFVDEDISVHIIEKFGRAHVDDSVDCRYFTNRSSRQVKIIQNEAGGGEEARLGRHKQPDSADNSTIQQGGELQAGWCCRKGGVMEGKVAVVTVLG